VIDTKRNRFAPRNAGCETGRMDIPSWTGWGSALS
jgi:hypothetical protein